MLLLTVHTGGLPERRLQNTRPNRYYRTIGALTWETSFLVFHFLSCPAIAISCFLGIPCCISKRCQRPRQVESRIDRQLTDSSGREALQGRPDTHAAADRIPEVIQVHSPATSHGACSTNRILSEQLENGVTPSRRRSRGTVRWR